MFHLVPVAVFLAAALAILIASPSATAAPSPAAVASSGCMPVPGLGCIIGRIFHDLNHDGLYQPGEPGLAGWPVHLVGPVPLNAVTDTAGIFAFPPVPYGFYTVLEEVQPGCTPADPPPLGVQDVNLTPEEPVVVVEFPVHCGEECRLDWAWRRGPAIKIVSEPNYWPNGETLLKMRPGDVIGLSVLASDFDYMTHKCTDCKADSFMRKWGPFEDTIVYDWTLVSGDPGTLILPDSPYRSMVMYQIPICGWTGHGSRKTARAVVDIRNDSEKADDLPITGTRFIITMMQDCPVPDIVDGWIAVSILVETGEPHDYEVIPEGGPGTCEPQPPLWGPNGGIISTSGILLKDAQNLCPEYLTLLSVDPSDMDDAEIKCVDPDPACAGSRSLLMPFDPVHYQWEIVSGGGEFPLGYTGPSVVFRRSRSGPTLVRVTLTDSRTQFIDPPTTRDRSMTMPRKPKAYVGVGNISTIAGFKMGDMYDAAELAKQKYEQAGYEVEYMVPTDRTQVTLALKYQCYQALWLCGHGAAGEIELDGDPPPVFKPRTIKSTSKNTWGCDEQPFIRELVLLGCNTYSAGWRTAFVCPKVLAFKEWLMANNLGVLLGRNPLVWERKHHQPIAPHDLTAP